MLCKSQKNKHEIELIPSGHWVINNESRGLNNIRKKLEFFLKVKEGLGGQFEYYVTHKSKN